MEKKNGIIETKYETVNDTGKTQIQSRIEYKDGVKNGIYEVYNSNNILLLKTNYKDDLKDGNYLLYYDDGILKCKTCFKNNKINGNKVNYYKDGKIEEIGNYVEDLLHGEYKKYDTNGVLIEHSHWNYGRKMTRKEVHQRELHKNIYPELIRKTWHPKRVMDWCLTADDLEQ